MKLDRILVPIDFSETAQHALDYAGDLAQMFGAEVHLLHVVPDPVAQGWAGEATGMVIPDLLRTWEADSDQRLQDIAIEGVTVERVTAVGHDFVEILKYASGNGIDLIVMGTHGRQTHAARQRCREGSPQGALPGSHRAPPGLRVHHADHAGDDRRLTQRRLCARPAGGRRGARLSRRLRTSCGKIPRFGTVGSIPIVRQQGRGVRWRT